MGVKTVKFFLTVAAISGGSYAAYQAGLLDSFLGKGRSQEDNPALLSLSTSDEVNGEEAYKLIFASETEGEGFYYKAELAKLNEAKGPEGKFVLTLSLKGSELESVRTYLEGLNKRLKVKSGKLTKEAVIKNLQSLLEKEASDFDRYLGIGEIEKLKALMSKT
ncbi:hypothetical protein MHLP_02715 [Candidatus Mycoplasma haematolamae str. Purdue]|uniref:Uncharacterized protein n=1 Tax=Mycoplasma haematolamae (strain Purdue) TaxID=1212765 RepID=I7BJS9_MYCHA|nr:hypothetical protein [Candidatus Mycoplasma haematolamae]AFO52123.1 hypothetical protein MHLP_02715 [Candidatus Mycoplasma haematolamae str. Purdue]